MPYIGFSDPRVQKLWRGLSTQERREIMKRLGGRGIVPQGGVFDARVQLIELS